MPPPWRTGTWPIPQRPFPAQASLPPQIMTIYDELSGGGKQAQVWHNLWTNSSLKDTRKFFESQDVLSTGDLGNFPIASMAIVGTTGWWWWWGVYIRPQPPQTPQTPTLPKDQQQKLESRVQVPPLRPNVQNRGGKITIVFINHWSICSQSFGLVGWAVGEITLVVVWKMLSIVSNDIG